MDSHYSIRQRKPISFRSDKDLVNLNMRRKLQHFKTHLESHLSMELLESTLQSLGLGLSLACGRGDLRKCVHELQKITKKVHLISYYTQ